MNGSSAADEGRIDTLYSILADGERRTVVRMLAANDTPISVSELADRIAGHRGGGGFHVRLYHQHLPKMRKAGVVVHDWDADRVSLTQRGRRVDEIIERTARLLDEGACLPE